MRISEEAYYLIFAQIQRNVNWRESAIYSERTVRRVSASITTTAEFDPGPFTDICKGFVCQGSNQSVNRGSNQLVGPGSGCPEHTTRRVDPMRRPPGSSVRASQLRRSNELLVSSEGLHSTVRRCIPWSDERCGVVWVCACVFHQCSRNGSEDEWML